MDVGHAKPRAEIFQAAVDELGMPPHEILHIGDNERTDVAGRWLPASAPSDSTWCERRTE
jgi:FMN phosphatase YigB (HAD superfamily)